MAARTAGTFSGNSAITESPIVFDDTSAEFLNCAADKVVMVVEHEQAGRVAEAVKIGGRTDNVSEEDGEFRLVTTKFFVDLGPRPQELIDVVFAKIHFRNSAQANLA